MLSLSFSCLILFLFVMGKMFSSAVKGVALFICYYALFIVATYLVLSLFFGFDFTLWTDDQKLGLKIPVVFLTFCAWLADVH